MRTFEELKKDPVVLAVAVDFDHGVGKDLNLKYMQLLHCFLGTCSLHDLAKRVGVGHKKLSRWYQDYFAEYVGYETLDQRGRHNSALTRRKMRQNTGSNTAHVL